MKPNPTERDLAKRIYMRSYRERNKIRIAEKQKEWRAANPDVYRASTQLTSEQYALKQEIVELKLKTPCVDCGGHFPACAMDFHHKEQNKKKFSISKRLSFPGKREILLEEIAKCELVCANCHRVRSWKQRWCTDGKN